jgi:hypothetical protein
LVLRQIAEILPIGKTSTSIARPAQGGITWIHNPILDTLFVPVMGTIIDGYGSYAPMIDGYGSVTAIRIEGYGAKGETD